MSKFKNYLKPTLEEAAIRVWNTICKEREDVVKYHIKFGENEDKLFLVQVRRNGVSGFIFCYGEPSKEDFRGDFIPVKDQKVVDELIRVMKQKNMETNNGFIGMVKSKLNKMFSKR